MNHSPHKKLLVVLAAMAALIGSPTFSHYALAAEGSHLIFIGPIPRYKIRANTLNRTLYNNKAEIIWGRPLNHNQKPDFNKPVVEILEEIEKLGEKGIKISSIDIIGHGYYHGPHISNIDNEDPTPPESRLEAGKVRAWTKKLRGQGLDPRDFFVSDATITIYACYAGRGARSLELEEREDLPQALLKILPNKGKVISDFDSYWDDPSGLVFETWSRQRITTREKDEVFDKKNKGAKKSYKNAFKELKAKVTCTIDEEDVKNLSNATETRYQFVRHLNEKNGIGVTFKEKETKIWVDDKLVPESKMPVKRTEKIDIRIDWDEHYDDEGEFGYKPKPEKTMAKRLFYYIKEKCSPEKRNGILVKYIGEDDNKHQIEVECNFKEP